MENIRSRSRSETRPGRFASRPSSRQPSRENSRDRARASSRERRKNEMRPVNFDSLENPDLKKMSNKKQTNNIDNPDSSDDSNWDHVLNKHNGKFYFKICKKKDS